MTIGTRIKDTGVVSTNGAAGASIEKNSENYGFMPYKVDSITQLTGSATIPAGFAGVIALSAAVTPITGTLPLASTAPGAMYTFRNVNAVLPHRLTCSLETLGATPITDGYTKGARLTIAAGAGGSVAMLCDGVNYLILGGASGSFLQGAGAGSLYTIA